MAQNSLRGFGPRRTDGKSSRPAHHRKLPSERILVATAVLRQWLRDLEVSPEEYFPEGYHPELFLEWPMKEVITMPMPDSMVDPKYKKKAEK